METDHTKNGNSVINYSPSCRSKPVRPSFIFGTQIKICFIKSESSLTLHRQQCNWNVPRSRNVARTSAKQSMWHQGFNRNFTKLRESFLCTRKTKITILFNNYSPPHPVCCDALWTSISMHALASCKRHMDYRCPCYVSGPEQFSCVAVYGGSESREQCLNLCSESLTPCPNYTREKVSFPC